MQSTHRYLAVVGAAAAISLALSAPMAFASTSQITVHANGSTSGTAGFYGASTGSPGASITAGTMPIECAAVSASGSFTRGSSTDGVGVGSITSTTWTGCTALGGSVDMSVTQNGVWPINAGDPTSAAVTPVTVTNVSLHLMDTSFGGTVCNFDITGSVDGYFDESDQVLHITAPTGSPMAPFRTAAALTLRNVTADCLGEIAENDPATIIAVLALGEAASPHPSLNIDITQP